jgi:hypothetical protein
MQRARRNGRARVIGEYKNPAQAERMLQSIERFAKAFISHLKVSFIDRRPITPHEKKGNELTQRLINQFHPRALRENRPSHPAFTSYTYNKGEVIALCLREQGSGQYNFHDMGLVQYVFLHELAHVAAKKFDNNHDLQFMSDFKFLLYEARAAGLHDPVDYRLLPTEYCSIQVQYSPLFDPRVDMDLVHS